MITSSPETSNSAGFQWTWTRQNLSQTATANSADKQSYSIYAVKVNASDPQSAKRPALLCVHGFGASTDHWRKNLDCLSQDFDCYAIDLLGFGRSEKPAIEYSGELWREQLHDFIRQEIGRPTVLLGNSLGGYASLCVTAAYPDSTAGLILLNSAGPFSSPPSPPSQPSLLKSVRNKFAVSVRTVLLQPWASYLLFQYVRRRSFVRKTLEKVYVDRSAVTERLIDEICRPSYDSGAAQVFAAVFKSRQGETVDHLLQQLARPLLMIWGEGDPWMDTRTRSEQFRRYYPSLTEHFLNAGHCPHDEVPEQVNHLVREWVLSEVVDRSPTGT